MHKNCNLFTTALFFLFSFLFRFFFLFASRNDYGFSGGIGAGSGACVWWWGRAVYQFMLTHVASRTRGSLQRTIVVCTDTKQGSSTAHQSVGWPPGKLQERRILVEHKPTWWSFVQDIGALHKRLQKPGRVQFPCSALAGSGPSERRGQRLAVMELGQARPATGLILPQYYNAS